MRECYRINLFKQQSYKSFILHSLPSINKNSKSPLIKLFITVRTLMAGNEGHVSTKNSQNNELIITRERATEKVDRFQTKFLFYTIEKLVFEASCSN